MVNLIEIIKTNRPAIVQSSLTAYVNNINGCSIKARFERAGFLALLRTSSPSCRGGLHAL